MHNFSISRVVSDVIFDRFHSAFSVPEVNLSAMSGYLAPTNIAETQFDDDETGIRRRAGQRRKLHSVLFFQRL